MRSRAKCLIALTASIAVWGARAHAEEPQAPPPPPPDTPAQPSAEAPAEPPPDAPPAPPQTEPAAVQKQGMSDEELAELSEAETIEIYDERPDKPFDRDTDVRLTGEQLAARGAVDLATRTRSASRRQRARCRSRRLQRRHSRRAQRRGQRPDRRRARQRSVLRHVRRLDDPDHRHRLRSGCRRRRSHRSMVPVVRAASIEVLTRDAIGAQLIIARATVRHAADVSASRAPRASRSRSASRCASPPSGQAGARDLDCQRSSHRREPLRDDRLGAARVSRRDRARSCSMVSSMIAITSRRRRIRAARS